MKKYNIDVLISRICCGDPACQREARKGLRDALGIGDRRLRSIRNATVGDPVALTTDQLITACRYFNCEFQDFINYEETEKPQPASAGM